jgi:hypothetical protein
LHDVNTLTLIGKRALTYITQKHVIIRHPAEIERDSAKMGGNPLPFGPVNTKNGLDKI